MSSKLRRLWGPALGVICLIVLAAGLSHVSFEGTRYGPPSEPLQEPSSAMAAPQHPENERAPLWEHIVIIALMFVVLISVVSVIFHPKNLWEAIRRALPAALWFAAIYMVILRWRDRPFFNEGKNAPPGTGALPPKPDQPFPSIEQVHVPNWAPFLFVFLALVALGAILFRAWRVWRARPRPVVADFAQITKQYAHKLRTGAPVQETILRCYREMCHLLSERFHLEISRAMTAREFERRLSQIGVREEHISQLSRLFEWARYSAGRPTPEQEHEALQLLEEIARIYGSRRAEVPHPA